MKRLFWLALILLPAISDAQSHPVFFNTSHYNGIRTQMKADYEADADCTASTNVVNTSACAPTTYGGKLYKLIHDNCAVGNRYSDFGEWCAWMYRATGTTAYATQSYAKVNERYLSIADTFNALCGNESREHFITQSLNYDQIYQGIDAASRTAFLTKLKTTTNLCVTGATFGSGTGGGADSDQTVGNYFGMAMLCTEAASYDATLDGYCNDASRKLGSLTTATATDNANRRNVIKYYLTNFATGGEWMEGDEYNTGTKKLLLEGAEAMRTAQAPTDNFSEITSWTADAANVFMALVTTGANYTTSQPYQWGDEENARSPRWFYRWETAAVIGGLLPAGAPSAQYQDWVLDIVDSATNGIATIDPFPRLIFLWDPYAPRSDYTTSDTYSYSSGQGLWLKRSGWSSSESLFGAQFVPITSFDANHIGLVQHTPPMFGEVSWWKNGEWILTHPRSYAGPSLDSRGSNGMSFEGLPAQYQYGALQYHSVRAQEDDTTNDYTYISGTMGGYPAYGGYYKGGEPYIHEHTRSIVALPSFGVMVVHDRTNAKEPQTAGFFDGYPAATQTWMNSVPYRKMSWWHSPVAPTLGSGYLEWQRASGRYTRISTVLPTSPNRATENESTLWVSGYYGLGTMQAAEKKFHTYIAPASDQQWDTFLEVIDDYSVTPKTAVLVQDVGNKEDGVLVTSGSANRLLLFNAVQGADLPGCTRVGNFCNWNATGGPTILADVAKRTTNFSVTFTVAGGSTTKALIFHLDTNKTWSSNVNGAGAATLTPSSQGVGVVDISATGSVTLAIATTGIADLTIETTSPLPNGTQDIDYSYCLVAVGGVPPYTWSKTGSLPTGLSLGAGTGCITGTPTGTGTSSWSTSVQDSQGSPDSATLNPTALTIDVASTPTTITTTSLADPTVNASYSASIAVTGGTGVYTCSLFAGSLPAGLSLSSNCTTGITGTATVADQSVTFTIRACDNAGSPVCDDQDYSMHVDFTNPSAMRLTIVGIGATDLYGYYGAPTLDNDTTCTMSMSGQADQTSTSGLARRQFIFSGLTAQTSYDMTAACVGLAFPALTTITTRAIVVASKSYGFGARPMAILSADTLELYIASSAANVATILGSGTYTSRSTSCSAGCTLTTSLSQGVQYRAWIWKNGSTEVARSAIQPFVVE